jgi:hypothetical protein
VKPRATQLSPFPPPPPPSLDINVDGSVLGLVTLCVSQTRPINSPVGREIALDPTLQCSNKANHLIVLHGRLSDRPSAGRCIFSNTTCWTPSRTSNASPDPILLLGISKLPRSHIPTRAAQLNVEPTPA